MDTVKSLTVPRIRTARIITSSQAVIVAAQQMGVAICMAYVDSTGYTRMLWRDQQADAGGLLRAENAAWSAVVKAQPQISILEFLENRRRSNHINALQEGTVNIVFERGGVPLMVDRTIVGAVAVIGAPELNALAVEAYMGTSPFDPTRTNHFSAFQTARLKVIKPA